MNRGGVPLDRVFNVSQPQCSTVIHGENLNSLFREVSWQRVPRQLFSLSFSSLFIKPDQTPGGNVEKVYVPPTPLIRRMFLKHASHGLNVYIYIYILFTRKIKNIPSSSIFPSLEFSAYVLTTRRLIIRLIIGLINRRNVVKFVQCLKVGRKDG